MLELPTSNVSLSIRMEGLLLKALSRLLALIHDLDGPISNPDQFGTPLAKPFARSSRNLNGRKRSKESLFQAWPNQLCRSIRKVDPWRLLSPGSIFGLRQITNGFATTSDTTGFSTFPALTRIRCS